MSKTTKAAADMEESREALRKLLNSGDKVYCILRHVSSSGMSRVIDLVIPTPAEGAYDGKAGIRSIGWHAARAMGSTWDDKRQGIKIGGCGMDMGFALVYNLGHAVWPEGTPEPHSTRNGAPDSDGGYALKSVWL